MASGLRSKSANVFVYVLLGLLIVGLAGFGIGNFGGNLRSIGKVGDTEIPVDTYYRALQQELSAASAQMGQNVTMAQAQQMGLDRSVLARTVALAALDNEAARIGLSVGDRAVLDEIRDMREFQGIGGAFDEETYRFVLEQSGLDAAEFEEQMRTDVTRSLLQLAVTGGTAPSATYTDTLLVFLAERRNLEWARLGPDALQAPLPDPTEAELQAYYDENPALFTLPEQRRVRYAWLTPDMILDDVQVDEDSLRAVYEERSDTYDRPEARLVERLIFPDAAAAQDARARLDAGEASFEVLVEERGLAMADIDLGDVAADDLPGTVSDAVFALTEPGIVGPLDSELGPALYRVNAILAAQHTPFDEVREQLRDEFARDAARRQVTDSVTQIDDLLAGGATLEEVAAETDMQAGTVTLPDTTGATIAGYEEFREAVANAAVGDYAEVAELSDGSIYAFELEEVIAPKLQPLDDVREQALASWRVEATRKALAEQATALLPELDAGQQFSALGLDATAEEAITRDRFVPDTPPALVAKAFELEPGKSAVVEGADDAYIVRLTGISEPDAEDADVARIKGLLDEQYAQGVANDIYDLFAQNRGTNAGIELNQAAINAVHAQIP
ncbi:MAG: peptidyl-prolyl cis-trans isomerase [Brevirhabdus sp.]